MLAPALIALILVACSSPDAAPAKRNPERQPWEDRRPGVALMALTSGYLSDKSYTYAYNEWGPVERDQNNGRGNANDGGPIKLNGVTYAKGLGIMAISEIRYNLGGACQRFKALVGLDDLADYQNVGSVIFQVFKDNLKIYDSGVMRRDTSTASVNVDITGGSELKLIVTTAGDDGFDDIADWAEARVECDTGGGGPTPFRNTPASIPGKIEAENFDEGGQNVAYGDTSTGNRASPGNTYRTSDVDIYPDENAPASNQILGWPDNGEYLIYTTNVTAGTYDVKARIAASGVGTFHLELDNVNITGPMQFTNTGGYNSYGTVTKSNLVLTAGQKRLKLVFDDGNLGDVDFLEFTASGGGGGGFNGGPQAASKGAFGPVQDWPTIATFVALLPDGKVISWYDQDNTGNLRDNQNVPHDKTQVFIWDPAANAFSRVDNTATDLFCAGFSLDAQGRLVVAGGNLGTPLGSKDVNRFDPTTSTWTRLGQMTNGRWYPTVTALANGELLIIGGTNENRTSNGPNTVADVVQTNGTLRRLTTAVTTARPGGQFDHYYPWMFQAPNGQVFNAGPSTIMSYLNTSGTGSWSAATNRGDGAYRTYGTGVMYDVGKILALGGLFSSARVVDIGGATPSVSTTGSMKYVRRHQNAVVLPDGRVVVIGGNTDGANFDNTNSVYESEIWSPATGTFTPAAVMVKPRIYHSVGLLLPDGRVLSAGGGGCGTGCVANQPNAEIYYPPYLFRNDGSGNLAARPTISSAPANVAYNTAFSVASPDAASISGASLIRLGAPTHAFDQSQRRVPVSFTRSGTTLTLTGPANTNIAPPGHYMLFIINSNGVPSVAKIVKVG